MKLCILGLLVSASSLFAQEQSNINEEVKDNPDGWSFDVGGTYTFVEISTPPTYHGSTGGVLGKLTYQKHDEFFGQARTFYNLGPLDSSFTKSRFYEWYTEFVGGYCFQPIKNWTITPYVGLGIEFLHDDHHRHHAVPPIKLRYNLFYAVAGFDTHYAWTDWMLGLQVDCLPTFNQYLRVKSLYDAAWVLKNRVGADVRLPVAYRYVMNFWIELAPYYRYMPIGHSDALGLPHRNLNEWGVFLTFRFFP
jgi:hypothetical protein